MGQHVPMWVHKSKAGQLLAQHGANNMVIAHPGIPIPLPTPDQSQTPPPPPDSTEQQPQIVRKLRNAAIIFTTVSTSTTRTRLKPTRPFASYATFHSSSATRRLSVRSPATNRIARLFQRCSRLTTVLAADCNRSGSTCRSSHSLSCSHCCSHSSSVVCLMTEQSRHETAG
jgi:hypothetical protein